MEGIRYLPVRLSGRGSYNERNRPYLDFIGQIVTDDRGFANIIRGRGAPPPPETDKGHFHLDYADIDGKDVRQPDHAARRSVRPGGNVAIAVVALIGVIEGGLVFGVEVVIDFDVDLSVIGVRIRDLLCVAASAYCSNAPGYVNSDSKFH